MSKITVLKWSYILVSEIIGWAGVPDDIVAWKSTMKPYLELLDYWIVRTFLVVSGVLVFAYPMWSPWVWSRVRNLYSKLLVLQGIGTPLKNKELEKLRDRIEIEKTYVSLVENERDDYKKKVEDQEKKLSDLRSNNESLQKEYGKAVLWVHGRSWKSRKLSVAVQHVRLEDDELAKQIRGLLAVHLLQGGDPLNRENCRVAVHSSPIQQPEQ